jgi:hypothetical protein
MSLITDIGVSAHPMVKTHFAQCDTMPLLSAIYQLLNLKTFLSTQSSDVYPKQSGTRYLFYFDL